MKATPAKILSSQQEFLLTNLANNTNEMPWGKITQEFFNKYHKKKEEEQKQQMCEKRGETTAKIQRNPTKIGILSFHGGASISKNPMPSREKNCLEQMVEELCCTTISV